jgi:hypothetical protein
MVEHLGIRTPDGLREVHVAPVCNRGAIAEQKCQASEGCFSDARGWGQVHGKVP